MTNKTEIIKVVLRPEDAKALRMIAREVVGSQRGYLTRFVEKISRERIIFLDRNIKELFKHLKT